jgi:hypothetical protein
MSKEKNKNTFRIGALLLVACLISSVMLSGTFAKYTSEYSGQDTALVARWSFEAIAGSYDTEDEFQELDLFGHAYTTGVNNNDDGEPILAPGVQDEFIIKMDYIADVDADVTIAFEELDDNAAVPIEYFVVEGGTQWVTLSGLGEELAHAIGLEGAIGGALDGLVSDPIQYDSAFRIARVNTGSTDDVNISKTVKWKWRYTKNEADSAYLDQTDANDTLLGTNSQAAVVAGTIANRTTYGIKVTINATQVVPTGPAGTAVDSIAIAGTAEVGQVLTADSLSPADATVTYQWQRSNGANYENIPGETGKTYTIVAGDSGKTIRVVATGTNSYRSSVTSDPVAIPY